MTVNQRVALTWAPARLWRWRADRARNDRRWKAASGNYERYLAMAPDDGPIWMQLGHARKEGGDHAGAGTAYQRALDLGETEARIHLAGVWTIERLAINSPDGAADGAPDWPAVAAVHLNHLEIMPDDGTIWVQYGHALKRCGDMAGALIAYRQAAALPASEEDGRFQLGCALRASGLDEAAQPHFRRALQLAPRLEIYRQMNDQPSLLAQASMVWDERCLVLDISDLLNFVGIHGLVTGIQRVQLELAKAVLQADRRSPVFERIVLCFSEFGWAWALAPEDLRELISYAESPEVDPPKAMALLERIRVQARPCVPQPGSAYVVVGGFWGGAEVRFTRERLRSMGVSFGVLTHDLFAITMPELCDEGVSETFEASFRAGLASWDFILANSEFTAGDIRAFMARNGGGEAPVIALPLAHSAGGARRVTPAPETRNRFVLCVGTIEPRKNHAVLIEAWTKLGDSHPDLPELVLVGRRGWRSEALVRRLESGTLEAKKVRWLQDVSDTELDSLYRSCLFTVFPSLAEGWGLPVGESLAHGKVCVTSNRTAMPEVGGQFAVYADPHDVDDLRRALERLIYDGKTLGRQEDLIRREFRPRTWSDVADDLIERLSARLSI